MAIVGTELSTVNEDEFVALNGFEARSDHALLATEIVGEPFPVQLLKVTTAVVEDVTFVDFEQVAPLPFTVTAESRVADTRVEGFASEKVSVKLLVPLEVTIDAFGEEMVTVGLVTSNLKLLVDEEVNPLEVMDATTVCEPSDNEVVSTVPLKSEPLQVAVPVTAPLSMLILTFWPAAEQVPCTE